LEYPQRPQWGSSPLSRVVLRAATVVAANSKKKDRINVVTNIGIRFVRLRPPLGLNSAGF